MDYSLSTEPPAPEVSPEQRERLAWRKNAPHIYSTLVTISLPWPSLTVQWLPEIRTTDRSQELVLGTRTGGTAPEHLRFGRVTVPRPELKSLNTYERELGTFGTHGGSSKADFEIGQRIDHWGEVNRARYMPQNPNLVATMSSDGAVCVFDRTKFSINPIGNACPSITLKGHKAGGFAIDWSTNQEGWLVSASNDGRVMVWDIKTYSPKLGEIEPVKSLALHGGQPINDAKWVPGSMSQFASCGDDKTLVLYNWVDAAEQRVTLEETAYALAFNPANQNLLAVGLESGQIDLYDVRSLTRIHRLQSSAPHTKPITSLDWNQRHTALLASGSVDCSVNIWDASLIGSGQEHRFRHLGHTAPIADLGWNAGYDLMLASVAEDNSLHLWEPVWDEPEVQAETVQAEAAQAEAAQADAAQEAKPAQPEARPVAQPKEAQAQPALQEKNEPMAP